MERKKNFITESHLNNIISNNINEMAVKASAYKFASHMVNEAIIGSRHMLMINEGRVMITEGAWVNTLIGIAMAAAAAVGYNMSQDEAEQVVQQQIEQTQDGYSNRFDREAAQGVADAKEAQAGMAQTWPGKRAEERNLQNRLDQSRIARGERGMDGSYDEAYHQRMEKAAAAKGYIYDRTTRRTYSPEQWQQILQSRDAANRSLNGGR